MIRDETLRPAFEAGYHGAKALLVRKEDGKYMSPTTENQWIGFCRGVRHANEAARVKDLARRKREAGLLGVKG